MLTTAKLMKKLTSRGVSFASAFGSSSDGNVGYLDVDDQQRDGDGHDRIAEEDQALQTQLLMPFHRSGPRLLPHQFLEPRLLMLPLPG